MRWEVWTSGVVLALLVATGFGKPAEHVTEERREYYHKTSKVIDTPIIYTSSADTHGSYTADGDALQSAWAQNHMDEIRKMAERLRWEYNQKRGGVGRKGGHRMRHGYSSISMSDFPSFSGKTKEELDMLARQMTEQMILDMKSGKLLYSQVVQPNWFEKQAAQQLQSMSQTQSNQDQETQTFFGAEGYHHMPQTIGGGYHRTEEKKHIEYSSTNGGYQPAPTYPSEVEDLNRREEHSSVVYPTTVTIIGGNRYVTKKNCTTSSSTLGSPIPTIPNYITRTTSYDKNFQNILEHGREIPIVIDQSSYNKEENSYNKQQKQQSVPVYPGSYFTGNHYDSQYQNSNQDIPVQSQVYGHSSETRDSSQYHRQYQPITIGGTSQTIQTSSSTVQERENQQVPIVIPTQQTSSSSSETYSQSESQRPFPVVYPSSSIQRESSSYESTREHQAAPSPIPATQLHSIYRHLQKETEIIPDYKPVVTIDSQTIDTENEELHKYYQQRPSAIARTEETERVEQERQEQHSSVVPEITITIHDQENTEDVSDRQVQPVRPTIASSQQTTTSGQQSSVLYRPSYPAYGSQFNRNDSTFHERYQTRYQQPVVSSSTYEKQEEDRSTTDHHQEIPVYGHTSQNTEEVSSSQVYRSRERPVPIVLGGSTSYQESHEEHRTIEHQQPVPQTTVVQQSQEEIYTGQRQQHVPQTTTYQESFDESQEQRTSEKQVAPQIHQTSEVTTETNQTTTQQRQRPIYINGVTSYQMETEDQSQESARQRQYPTGHQTSQITSESEDSYWSRQNHRPQSTQTSQTQSESEYSESSRIRYPQTGVVTSQNTQEYEAESEDIRRRPGQIGYTVTTHVNETSSSSSTGKTESIQSPVVISQSQDTILEGGSQSGSQVVLQSGHGETIIEKDVNNGQVRDDRIYFPVESEQDEGKEVYESGQQQGSYGGGMKLEHSEYGSQVNRNITTGGGSIGYVTHQLTIEQQEEEWRRQQEERRRQQLISTGIFESSSLNTSSNFGTDGLAKVDIAKLGIHDGDESRLRNGTQHLDKAQYGTSVDVSSTYASGKPPATIISKDRGDQPPHHYEEDYDMNEAEPGIGYYPSEPEVANQVVPSTTPRIPPVYTAPLAPLVIEKDLANKAQETTVDVWPTTAGETEVQRTYHKKKTVITQTIPVLLGPNGEIIHEGGAAALISEGHQTGSIIGGIQQSETIGGGNQQVESTASSSQQTGSIAGGSYQISSGGSYQSQVSGAGSLTMGSLTDQHHQDQDEDQAYLSESTSHQEAAGQGGYGSSVYGSQARYTVKPEAVSSESTSHQEAAGQGGYGSSVYGSQARYTVKPEAVSSENTAGSYATGSSSSSISYQGGGSYSQASAYGHQQHEGDDLEAHEQQLNAGVMELGGHQHTEDLTQQFVDHGQETEGLNQEFEGYRQYEQSQSEGIYDQSQNYGAYDQSQNHGMYDQFESHGMYDQSQNYGMHDQPENHGMYDQSQNHGMYDQSSAEVDQGTHGEEQSSSSNYQKHSSYSSSFSSSSSSGGSEVSGGGSGASGSAGSSITVSAQIPSEVHDEEPSDEDQDKPGFWRRIGKKAKDLFG